MAKITGLSINQQFGCLKAQRLEFTDDTSKLIEVKGIVGSGKSTINRACLVTTAGKEALPESNTYGDTFDIETEICMLDGKKVFCRTTKKELEAPKSIVYLKDAQGKKVKNFILNNEKVTPSKFLKMLRTELTFGIDDFLSDHSLTHFKFMSELFQHKLKDVGIVLDKKSECYQGSILDQLDRAIILRADLERKKKACNGFKTALEEEGYNEENMPDLIDVDDIKLQIEGIRTKSQNAKLKAQEEHYKTQSENQAVYNKAVQRIKERTAAINNIFDNYNSQLDTKKELHESEIQKVSNRIEALKDALSKLQLLGYEGVEVQNFINTIKRPEKQYFNKVLFIDGKPQKDSTLPQNIQDAFASRSQLAREYNLIVKPETLEFSYTDNSHKEIEALKAQIETGIKNNDIYHRWIAFKDHSAAEKEVVKIRKEYRRKFTEVDFGVKGLYMDIDSNNEIKTYYNGVHNVEFFANKDAEPRLLSSYSLTQKNVIGVLMQIYLLNERVSNGMDPIRNMWVEFPMDNKTRDLLKDLQVKHDIQLITNTTGDFTEESLKDGEFLIEDGILLNK